MIPLQKFIFELIGFVPLGFPICLRGYFVFLYIRLKLLSEIYHHYSITDNTCDLVSWYTQYRAIYSYSNFLIIQSLYLIFLPNIERRYEFDIVTWLFPIQRK